jgi:ATP-dependent RNA helicase SUPV3L1/SUV3
MTAKTDRRISAVLGPTNTGKTHLAIERMLGHGTGMIGFPLRLLARENYDRIARTKGPNTVALVTGEERLMPSHPRWLVCTVEAMPIDRPVDFLAVDEIQLIGDRERGHTFTDRLLHARGGQETMFLGAESARPMIRKLVPGAEFITRARLSTLTWTGPKKITRLPKRSAIVAFSAAEVYGIAELVRRQRGGAAVVFGALSPRTRNAQVAMYQAGEVDHIVATDAIGMGLNMDIDHVAFAQLAKFDGRGPRRLTDAELAQIAGRAGRHMNDGTFGTTADIGPLEADTIEAIETHRFPPLTHVFWRNSALDFRSPELLLRSLERRAERPELVRVREATDHLTLAALLRDRDLTKRADSRARVALLWDICQIPDFRKILSDGHVQLCGQIFRYLCGPEGILPVDWVARHVDRLQRVDGDIDTLLQRIAHIRTWTYVSHRADWLADPAHWQERTRAIEDKLSDALHERLTQRFVDRRAAVLARRLAGGAAPVAATQEDGEVLVEGEPAGRLEGFNFRPAADLAREGGRGLLAAANTALRRDVPERVRRLETSADAAFSLDGEGAIRWRGQRLARLAAGDHILEPRLAMLPADLLEPNLRERVRVRLDSWLTRHIEHALKPLWRLKIAELRGSARGIAFELVESLGVLRIVALGERVAALSRKDRDRLQGLGVVLGEVLAFVPAVRRTDLALRMLLWRVRHGGEAVELPPDPVLRARSCPAIAGWPAGLAAAAFLVPAGPLLVRADRFEALARDVRRRLQRGPFAVTPDLAELIGSTADSTVGVLRALGVRPLRSPEGIQYTWPEPRGKRQRGDPEGEASPLAGLRDLMRP